MSNMLYHLQENIYPNPAEDPCVCEELSEKLGVLQTLGIAWSLYVHRAVMSSCTTVCP